DLEVAVYTNFKSETAANVLLFLAKEYNLSLAFTGSIISVSRTDPAAAPRVPASIRASYRDDDKTLRLELENDSQVAAARAITRVSGVNVVVTNDLKDRLVTLYVQDMAVPQALEQLAFTNKVKLAPTSAGAYVLMPLAENEENFIGKDAVPGTRQAGVPQ